MVSKSKLYTQLDLLESELREKLIPRLKSAARGNNDLIFCVDNSNNGAYDSFSGQHLGLSIQEVYYN